jgi:pilus assembly protein CpaC
LASFCLTFVAVQLARANTNVVTLAPYANTNLTVAQGKPRTVRTTMSVHEIVIGNPDIADISPLTDRSFYVVGNQLGTTGIALFDENKQLIGSLDIEVSLDTDRLADTIRRSVPDSDIRVQSANGRVLLSGTAKDAVGADRARSIASRYSGGEEVIDSVSITSSQQVQLNVRIVEINRQAGQELGARIGVEYVGAGGSASFNSTPSTGTRSPAGELIGNIVSGGLSVDVAIKALEDRGMARRLAEPNLIARSGQRASFLAGGEFPIPVPGEGGSVTIEYKRFGVGLDFTPTVLEDGLISLEIEPEVSSIDASASYNIGNISVPGFSVRRASTSIDLKSGQSFMIAGLCRARTAPSPNVFRGSAASRCWARCSRPRPISAARPTSSSSSRRIWSSRSIPPNGSRRRMTAAWRRAAPTISSATATRSAPGLSPRPPCTATRPTRFPRRRGAVTYSTCLQGEPDDRPNRIRYSLLSQ